MNDPENEFEKVSTEPQPGILKEFWSFLRENKKWWLLPLVVALVILGVLILLTSTGLAPFLYPFF